MTTVNHSSNSADRNPGDEAAPGTSQTGENICETCNGSGKNKDQAACPDCGGTGLVIVTVGDA